MEECYLIKGAYDQEVERQAAVASVVHEYLSSPLSDDPSPSHISTASLHTRYNNDTTRYTETEIEERTFLVNG